MSGARTNVQHLLQSEKEVCWLCRRRAGNKELVTQRVFVVYCCLLIMGPSCVFMRPLVLICWEWGGYFCTLWMEFSWWLVRKRDHFDNSVCPGAWRGDAGKAVALAGFQWGGREAGRVWAICSPCALQPRLLRSRFLWWADHLVVIDLLWINLNLGGVSQFLSNLWTW